MRLATVHGRAAVVSRGLAIDIWETSAGMFGPTMNDLLDQWEAFLDWYQSVPVGVGVPFGTGDLGAPVPRPRQVFAVALNYGRHAKEAGLEAEKVPLIFTKFPSSITGPYGDICTPTDKVDWEVELVVVMGREAYRVSAAEADEYIAGVTVGQDITDRTGQMLGQLPQFSMAKSHPGFSPIGPELVTLDEIDDLSALSLTCKVNGTTVQQGSISELTHSVGELIQYISHICRLYPGDLIFTGTPDGIGHRANPPRYLSPRDVLFSSISGIGTMEHRMI